MYFEEGTEPVDGGEGFDPYEDYGYGQEFDGYGDY